MKSLVAIFVWFVFVGTAVSFAAFTSDEQPSSPNRPKPMVVKWWKYGSGTLRTWVFRNTDQWGGMNYWCVGEGNSCGLYDWCAVYDGIVIAQDPCPENNNSQYGNNLVRAAASEDGISLPPDLPLPTFTIQQQGN